MTAAIILVTSLVLAIVGVVSNFIVVSAISGVIGGLGALLICYAHRAGGPRHHGPRRG